MSGFIAIAILLTLAALVALLYPLLRRGGDAPAAWRSAAITALFVIAGGVVLYPQWSKYKWDEPEVAADSPAAMVGRLARRLEKQPDDVQGWLMLGKSYSVIADSVSEAGSSSWYSLSARAYQRADTVAKGSNAEALMGLAEALVNAGRSDLGGRAGRLFEQALKLEPNLVKALYYSALAAAERNEVPLARARFQRLLEGNPPENVRALIERQVQALDGMAALAAAAPAGRAATTAAAKAEAVKIELHVTLAPAVAGKVAAGAPLFVKAGVPGQRGMPLAAKRLDAKFPQDVELLSTDAPMSGSGFSAGQELEIEARIGNGGSAISRSGDPYGVVRVKAGAKGRVSIEINQLKP